MKRTKCPCCGRENSVNRKVFTKDFHLAQAIMPFQYYDVFQCRGCGFVYAGNIEESISIEDYYSMMSKYEGTYSVSGDVRDYYDRVKSYIMKHTNKNDRILDIGCAFGGLLKVLHEEGYKNLYGLEPSGKNCEFANSMGDVEVFKGSVGDILPELELGGV